MLDLGTRSSSSCCFSAEDESSTCRWNGDLVQRYSGAEGHQPTPDPGRTGVTKPKKARCAMPDELLRLYAERKLVGGYAFAAITPGGAQLNPALNRVTPDRSSIEDVKHDMEEPTPMDRLLRRRKIRQDRVAMRCVQGRDGRKQAAVVTPTTVLTSTTTFRSRFAPFPVKIGAIALPFREGAEGGCEARRVRRCGRRYWHPPAVVERRSFQGTGHRRC